MKVDPRFLTSSGPQVFTGNELMLKGVLETDGGVHLLGGYPGSPIAGFFDSMAAIKNVFNDKGIRAVINHNEATAIAMLNGTQTLPCRAIIAMKSVGVHVAADALALGNMSGANSNGGAVVIYGDDPWSDSTQVAADSRYISKHLYIPVIEPSNPQEVKDYINLSFKLSARSELYAGYLITTNLADGGGSVQCKPNQYPDKNTINKFKLETAKIDLDTRVLLPPRTWWQEEAFTGRFARACTAARDLGMNRIDYPTTARKPLGFISSGLAYSYLVQVLDELGLLGEFPILKLGMSYPVDPKMIRDLSAQAERLVVIEERRGFIEEQVGQILIQDHQKNSFAEPVELWGKQFPGGLEGIPYIRGLHPSIIGERIIPLIKFIAESPSRFSIPQKASQAMDQSLADIESTTEVDMPVLPLRTASFCPGCPHRDSASVCLEIKKRLADAEYMGSKYKSDPVDLVFHGDIGCYTMLMFPPNADLMHNLSGMGLGGATGTGIDPFISNKQAVFMGDSTFFHCGVLAISQAIKLGQDITFIILDNSTTGMTGHQTTPGLDFDVLGNPTPTQDIEQVVRGLAAETEVSVARVDPEKRDQYSSMLEQTFLADGVKVVIATKECGITLNRRKKRAEREITRRLGFLPVSEHMNINPEVCRFCLACAEFTGCPGLRHVDTDYGPKVDTDTTWCVNDGACQRVGACWSFERVTVHRKAPAKPRTGELELDDIPEPLKRPAGDMWRCCLAGVGGMGIGLATSILVRAGHKEGYDVIFLDKKGLAIRNGGVVSQVVYNIASQPVTGIIPFAKADLLLGVDVLEAARTLDPAQRYHTAAKDKTAAVINTHKSATIRGVMGQDDYDVDELERVIKACTRDDDYMARDISRICQEYLGSKIYTNIMMLGFAFQKGLIPVSMHSMAWAIKDTIRAEFKKNLHAFNMGRQLVVREDLFHGPPVRIDWTRELDKKCRNTIRRYRNGQHLADQLRDLVRATIGKIHNLDETLKYAVVVRLYDCMRWDGMDYAHRYAEGITSVYAKDNAGYKYAATRAAIHNLASAMLIKDAIFIAELSTSPEKYRRDCRKYNIISANGDRISYQHLLRWSANLGPWNFSKFAVNFSVGDWVFKILKRMRFLRKLLPLWHGSHRKYLVRYARAVENFDASSPEKYRLGLLALSSPQCMDCIEPQCTLIGCPLGGQIPQWLEQAHRRNWRKAAEILHRDNNFPEFTSRLCPAPCQEACKESASDYCVQIRDIEGQVIEKAFENGWVIPQPAKNSTGKKVAIVGSGPAGLAAAQQLARAGHEVTVFEADDAIGGLLRYGVPDSRLEKQIIDRRLAQLKAEGVVFEINTRVGEDVTADSLLTRFDAVCLAAGARKPRDLDIPGRQNPNIHHAMEFLTGAIDVSGKIVVVIGGGQTGDDCTEAAITGGAAKVRQLELLDERQVRSDNTHEPLAQVEKSWCVATTAFEADNNDGLKLKCNKVQWLKSSKGLQMSDIPATEFTIGANIVLLALGFDAVIEKNLAEQLALELDAAGSVITKDSATSVKGVFAAGDLATGPSLIAAAINSGREAAEKINEYLEEER